MPRNIKKTNCRIPVQGGAIFKYDYMSKWKLDAMVNGERLRPTLAADQRESLRLAHEILEKAMNKSSSSGVPSDELTIQTVVEWYLESRSLGLPDEIRSEPRKDRTYRNDEDRLNLIVQRLPVQKVCELRKSHCLDFIKKRMTEKSKTNSKKCIGRTTATKPVRLLLCAFNHGMSQDKMTINPLLGLKLTAAKGVEIRKKRRAMTSEDLDLFKAAAVELDVEFQAHDGHHRVPQAPLYLSIYEAGRRLGEMLGLEWRDVHLDDAAPHWDFWDTKGQKLSASDQSEPEQYPIPPLVLEYIRALKAMHERHFGREMIKGDKVFLSPQFGLLDDANVRRHFDRILKRANIAKKDDRGRSLDIHAARMTVYARGAAAGIPVDQMMSFVGHKDIRTALNHYRDPKSIEKQKIAQKLAYPTK